MNGSTRGPRHAGSSDPLEFSLVEFCQLVDFLLDIVSLVSFLPRLSVFLFHFFFLNHHFSFECSCYFVFTFHSDQFFIVFLSSRNGLIASHWFHVSATSLTFISSLLGQTHILNPSLYFHSIIGSILRCFARHYGSVSVHLVSASCISLSVCSAYTGSDKACV